MRSRVRSSARAVPVGFIAQQCFDPFSMNVGRPLGLEEVGDGKLHQDIPHGCRIEDIGVKKDCVGGHPP